MQVQSGLGLGLEGSGLGLGLDVSGLGLGLEVSGLDLNFQALALALRVLALALALRALALALLTSLQSSDHRPTIIVISINVPSTIFFALGTGGCLSSFTSLCATYLHKYVRYL